MIESSSQPGASSDQMAVLVCPTDMSSISGGDLDVEFVPEETERLMAGEEEWREEEPTSSTHRWGPTLIHPWTLSCSSLLQGLGNQAAPACR